MALRCPEHKDGRQCIKEAHSDTLGRYVGSHDFGSAQTMPAVRPSMVVTDEALFMHYVPAVIHWMAILDPAQHDFADKVMDETAKLVEAHKARRRS